jgi:hypothetical protein
MRIEKAAGVKSGSTNINEHIDSTPRGVELQQVFNFGRPPKITTTVANSRKSTRYAFPLRQIVCDICCAPLYIYSENFIAAYLDERAELPPSLCDNHLSEMEAELRR